MDDMCQLKEEMLSDIAMAAEELRKMGVYVSIPGYDEILVSESKIVGIFDA